MKRFLLVILLVSPCFLTAGETRKIEITKKEDFLKAESLNGLMVTSKGELKLGWQFHQIELNEEASVWTGCAVSDGYFVGTPTGKIYKVENGVVTLPPFDTKDLIVTSIVSKGKEAYAATIPSGKIFKYSDGNWSEFAKTDTKYIWQLFLTDKLDLLAACGTPAKILKISQDESGVKLEKVWEFKAENALTVAQDGKDFYVGTSKPGNLFKCVGYSGAKRSTQIVYDFQEQEVKSIQISDKDIYVAVNNASNFSPYSFLSDVRNALSSSRLVEPKKPQPQSASTGTVSSSIWKITQSKTEPIVEFSPAYISEILRDGDGLLVGLSNSGRVFRVLNDGNYELPYNFNENQVLGFITEKGKLRAVCLGDRGALAVTTGKKNNAGEYVSQVFDSRFQSFWGAIDCKSSGKTPTARVRSGNISKPDTDWTEWGKPINSFPEKELGIPKSRYLQVKLTITDSDTSVSELFVSYRNENQRPKITDFKLQATTNPPTTGGPAPVPPHSTTKTITWLAHDVDGDTLSYQLYYKRTDVKDFKTWVPLLEDAISLPSLQWNTDTIPDGKYVLKLVASDSKSNLKDKTLTDKATSSEFTVDNTKPTIKVTFNSGGTIKGSITDKLSNIVRIEYQIDAGEWKTLQPKDEIFDSTSEDFEISLGSGKGPATVTIKAYDSEFNFGVAREEIK